jgi:hypothetical protein
MHTSKFVAILLCLVGQASAAHLRAERKLDIVNNYYWTLSSMMVYFDGQCNAEGSANDVTCSMPGYSATLQGTNEGGIYPQAQSLHVCEIKSRWSTSCNTYYFNGSTSLDDIITEAFPGLTSSSLGYRTVLFTMLENYGGSCDITTNHQKVISACTEPGAKSTLIGTISGPTPVSLEKCTYMTGGDSSCHTFNFDGNASIASVLSEAFP